MRADQVQVTALPSRFESSQSLLDPGNQTMGSLAYKLLILFLIQLYSNIAVLYPALEVIRPAMAIGSLALFVLLFEKLRAGQPFEFVWPDSLLLLLFVGAAALSSPGSYWPGWAVESSINLIKIVLIYFLILNSVDSERRLRGVVWAMVLCGLIPAIGALKFYHAGRMFQDRLGWVGIFGNPNELTYGLVILIPLAVAISAERGLLARLLIWAQMGIFSLVIYLTFSRGGMLGLFAVLALMAVLQRRASLRVLAVALMAAGLLAVAFYWTRGEGFSNLAHDASFEQRITTYKTGLAMFADHPVIGVGINCSMVAWPFYAPKGLSYNTWLIVHNTFLEALSETGLVGFIPFMAFLAYVLHRARKTARAARAAGRERFANLVTALEISFVGFLVCGLSGGFVMSWFPYILAAVIGAASKFSARQLQEPARPASAGVPARTSRQGGANVPRPLEWKGARNPGR